MNKIKIILLFLISHNNSEVNFNLVLCIYGRGSFKQKLRQISNICVRAGDIFIFIIIFIN